MRARGDSGAERVAVPSAAALAVSAYVALVIGVALAATAATSWNSPPSAADVGAFAVLAVLAVGYDWLARRVELVRRRTNSGPYVTMDSVWVLAAAVNVAPSLVLALLVLTQAHAEYQGRRSGSGKSPGRVLFNIAASLLPAVLVHELVARSEVLAGPELMRHSLLTPAVLIGAVLVYGAVNTGIVGVVLALSTGERRVSRLVGTVTENLVELATLTLGVLIGIALTIDIWLALLAVPILVLLQRVALVEHLESAASEDGKTGLLNAAAWNHLAERELERAVARGVGAAVMVVDLDHFKRVNDTFGHLAGDEVLKAVAACMRAMLREHDHLARFGGEEFVAFLPGADVREAERVAERLRRRIAETVVVAAAVHAVDDPGSGRAPLLLADDDVRAPASGRRTDGAAGAGAEGYAVTVSIGIAAHPEHGVALEELLTRADAALYVAKHAGRNRIRTAA